MRYTPLPHLPATDPRLRRPQSPHLRIQQPYDAFLILDVEATCFQGTDFNYPNEIIEFPICLMKWQDRDRAMKASKLQVVDEFRSFVRPSWRPTLSGFCTELTGITQEQVDAAPPFPKVLESVRAFLVKNGLIDDVTGKRLVRFCWCSDGPFDIRDFVVKQCFISKVSMPEWLTGDVLDVRMTVLQWLNTQPPPSPLAPGSSATTRGSFPPVRRSFNIPAQLKALDLPTFQGRQHSGIDDTRNIAKIVTELGKRGVALKPNTQIKPGRKWIWMGKGGEVLEQFCASFDENGNLASLPEPPTQEYDYSNTMPSPFGRPWGMAMTPPSYTSSASAGSESESGSDSGLSVTSGSSTSSPSSSSSSLPSLSSSYASAAASRGGLGQGHLVYGFGTATRPGSPAFWSPPRRSDSPVSIKSISSSPESESEFGIRIGKSFSPLPVKKSRKRNHHHVYQRIPTTEPGPLTIGIGVGARIPVDVGATTVCAS